MLVTGNRRTWWTDRRGLHQDRHFVLRAVSFLESDTTVFGQLDPFYMTSLMVDGDGRNG